MSFDVSYKEFLEFHKGRRAGERLRRLEEGLGHAEVLFLRQVWWPSFGNLKHLHPEYEISDFKDHNRYLDFAYIRPFFRMAIEIDGFGTHLRNIDRWQFADHLNRQNQLLLDGWKLVRFSYDAVKEKPRSCQQTLHQWLGKYIGEELSMDKNTPIEKEVIRLALRLDRPITPKDVSHYFTIDIKTARKILHTLVSKNWLQPANGSQRIRSYQLNSESYKDEWF